jgi:hypothetical protein
MAAYIATIRLCGTRLWRGLLASLISLALVASLFHCCCCVDGDEVTLTASAVQTSYDESGKTAPCSAGAHCCHCLAHVTTPPASPDGAVSIEYVKRVDRFAEAAALDSAYLDSPFKPPRV